MGPGLIAPPRRLLAERDALALYAPMNRSRRSFLGGLGAVLAAGPLAAGAPETSLRPRMRGAIAAEFLDGPEALVARAGVAGRTAFVVADAESGLVLESLHGNLGLPPASVVKALTALYALETLGAGYRFRTRLAATGSLQDGVLHGDLILLGGGDPSLDTDDLARMVSQLAQTGVRGVRGRFLVDEGALPAVRSIDPAQAAQLAYSPAVSGIALNYNRVHFEWKQAGDGYSLTLEARARDYRPAVTVAKVVVESRATPVYGYSDTGGGDSWSVARAALGTEGARWLPVRRPGAYAGDVFRTLAEAQGLALPAAGIVAGATPGDARVLVEHESEPLQEILRDMLKWSNNLTAEMVGMTATAARSGRPASMRASAQVMSDWAGARYGMRGARLIDHSGLGDASRMTPADLVAALVQANAEGRLRPLLKEFTLRDAGGRPDANHPIRVDAKTGTLNFVSGLGGFMTGADGTDLAFAIFSADADQRATYAGSEQEIPPGARSWNARAKSLQQKLIERWGALYCS